MQRDFSAFPEDENGETLWYIAQEGIDLVHPREIDFSVVFPTKESALEFSMTMLRCEQKVRCCYYEENDEFPMDVTVYPTMVPTHDNITAFEAELSVHAEPLGGHNDGWGFGT